MTFSRIILTARHSVGVLIAAVMIIPAVYALEINGYAPARHDRFISGYPDNPVANPDFFAAGYDWSGVGWGGGKANRSVALISPLHFVCSRHYEVPVGGSVNFLNRDGQVKSYTVAGYSTFASKDGNGRTHVPDLALGKLSRPIALTDNIGWYPVLNADDSAAPGSDSAQYVGKKIISYGAKARAGINEILSFAFICTNKTQQPDNLTFSAVSDFHPGLSAQFPDETGFAGGDSGGLSFIVWKNRLVLMGTHFAVGADGPIRYNVDAFLPYYLKDIISAMNGSGYSVSTIVVDPEPSSLQFLPL